MHILLLMYLFGSQSAGMVEVVFAGDPTFLIHDNKGHNYNDNNYDPIRMCEYSYV